MTKILYHLNDQNITLFTQLSLIKDRYVEIFVVSFNNNSIDFFWFFSFFFPAFFSFLRGYGYVNKALIYLL